MIFLKIFLILISFNVVYASDPDDFLSGSSKNKNNISIPTKLFKNFLSKKANLTFIFTTGASMYYGYNTNKKKDKQIASLLSRDHEKDKLIESLLSREYGLNKKKNKHSESLLSAHNKCLDMLNKKWQ